MPAKADVQTEKAIWRKAWSIAGSVPIWLKIMGIVLFPLFMVLMAGALYARHILYGFFVSQHNSININTLISLLTGQATLVIGSVLLAGIILAYVLSRILERPLNQLLAVIQRVEAGDLSARVPVWARDEIGRVQAAFNTMTANLQKTQDELLNQNRELAAVNELAEALTLSKGADAMVEIALKHVIAFMNFDVGSIYILEKDRYTMRLKASQGFLSPELVQRMSTPGEDNPMLRCLLENGRALLFEDVRSAQGQLGEMATLLAKDGLVSWACAPLKMEGDVIGLYHLGKHERRSFTSHDQALLEIIGNVVGSSLSNAQLLKDLRRKEWEMRRALHRSVDLQEDERKRLARELHDEVGQALTSILISLKTIQEEKNYETAYDRLDELRSLTSQTIEELRRIAIDLRPAALDSLGILPALRWYIKQSSDITGTPIVFNAPDKLDRLSADIELILYRVAQEGITNALGHGKARQVVVTLERDFESIRLGVADNGRGFDAAVSEHGLGLVGIRERVEMLDGKFSITSTPGSGAQLWIEIPLER